MHYNARYDRTINSSGRCRVTSFILQKILENILNEIKRSATSQRLKCYFTIKKINTRKWNNRQNMFLKQRLHTHLLLADLLLGANKRHGRLFHLNTEHEQN